MLYKNFTMLVSRFREWNIPDYIATAAIIFAVAVVGIHVYQVNTTLPYEETLQVTDPIQLTKQEYRLGEELIGYVEGERYSDRPVIFNRTLVCDDYRVILTHLRLEKPPIGPINRNTPLLVLDDNILVIEGAHLGPQKSCEIIYAPQTVMERYILGGEELQPDQSFRTTEFDIVE